MPTPVNKNNPNCIETSSFCIRWDGGDIDVLGICNGDNITNVIVEIVEKLKEIAGQDLSSFDIDTLLTICNQRAPFEKNLISILELLRDNQLCLKDYIDTLAEQIVELSKKQKVNVNLKCLADFDNFGNQLGVTREALDQIVIDKLCNHEGRILTVEGKITSLQNQINNIDINPQVQEPEFVTCVDPASKPTSGQVVSIANKVCSIDNILGSTSQFSTARSFWNSNEDNSFSLLGIEDFLTSPTNEAEYNRNVYLLLTNFNDRLKEIETNCCAPTCDKIMIGFSVAVEDSENGDYVIRFRPQDGTNLFGFVSTDSKVRFSGTAKTTGQPLEFGVVPTLDINIHPTDWDENIYNLSDFDLSKPITIAITANMVKDGLTCQKCIAKTIDISSGCPVCQVLASGEKGQSGTLTITYQYD